jgi:hypothetical protein
MTLQESKTALDNVIKKARVHFYKPIQIAEILYRDRVKQDIDLINIDTYRNTSKGWRDTITERFVGRSPFYQSNATSNVIKLRWRE